MNKPKIILLSGCALTYLGAIASLSAQTATSQTEEEEVFELSPFEVDGSKDVGYYSPSTMSGTRLNSSLYDTPSSVSEMTNQFLDDIGALNLQEAVEYALGFENDMQGSNDNQTLFQPVTVTARGLSTTGLITRDYYPYNSGSDWFSMESISLSRGPNAVLAGVGGAGGIMNTSSKRAVLGDRKNSVSVMFDAEGSFRLQLDHNLKVSDTFAIRANLMHEQVETWRDPEMRDSQGIQIATTWKPFENTTINAEYMRFEQDRMQGLRYTANNDFGDWLLAGSPEAYYNTSTSKYVLPDGTVSIGSSANRITLVSNNDTWYDFGGGAISKYLSASGRGSGGIKIDDPSVMPFDIALGGKSATSDNDQAWGAISLTQKLADKLYVDVGYNTSKSDRVVKTPLVAGDFDLRMDPNRNLPDGSENPEFGKYYFDGQAQATLSTDEYETARALLTYELEIPEKKWLGEHQFLAYWTESTMTHYGDGKREANLTPIGNSKYSDSTNILYRRTYVDFFDRNEPSYFDHNPYADDVYPENVALDKYNGTTVSGTLTPGFYRHSLSVNEDVSTATMLAGQSRFLNGRLALTWGVRDDEVKQKFANTHSNPLTGEVLGYDFDGVTSDVYSGPTKTKGGVLRVWKGLAVYYNESDNFSPQASPSLDGLNIGNVAGVGEEVGVKFKTEDGKYYAKLGRYETASANKSTLIWNGSIWTYNIWAAIEGTDGVHASAFPSTGGSVWDTKDEVVEGYEFEFIASPIDGLRFSFNASTLEAQTSNTAPRLRAMYADNVDFWKQHLTDTFKNQTVEYWIGKVEDRISSTWDSQEGNIKKGAYKYRYNGRVQYKFQDGRFKGLDMGFGLRVRDKRYIKDGVYGPMQVYTDLGIKYGGIRINDDVSLSLKLDVKNVFDDRDLVYVSDSNGLLYDYILPTPREIRLTSTFKY